jgi:hypothetical protein
MSSRAIVLPPFAAKPRPMVMPAARGASGYAVVAPKVTAPKQARLKQAGPKQAGPKPRYAVLADDVDQDSDH